jgi:hypothetical protein
MKNLPKKIYNMKTKNGGIDFTYFHDRYVVYKMVNLARLGRSKIREISKIEIRYRMEVKQFLIEEGRKPHFLIS